MKVQDLPKFKQQFCSYAKEKTNNSPYVNSIMIDACLSESDFSLDNFDKISLLEPYGMCNDVPMFCVKNVIIRDIRPIGNQKHLRLTFQIGSKWINAVYFGMRPELFAFEAQNCVDVIFQASINEFRGKSDIQMIVKGIRPYEKKYKQLLLDTENALCGSFNKQYYPDRRTISNIFRFCRVALDSGESIFEITDLSVLIKKSGLGYYNIQKIVASLIILGQIGVVKYAVADQQLMLLSIDDTKKVSLEQSELYRRMHCQ